jgi:hypothetical protein
MLIEELDIKPIGPISKCEKYNIQFNSKKNSKYPVYLKATVDKDENGVVRIYIYGRSMDKEALKQELYSIQKVLDNKDPVNSFQKEWNELGKDLELSDVIYIPSANSFEVAFDSLAQLLKVCLL